MHEPSRPTIHRFSTRDIPVAERFDAWMANSVFCDFAAYASDMPFDAQRDHAQLGPLVLGRRTWTHPDPSTVYEAKRTAARIRADQRDFISVSLQVSGSAALRSDGFAATKSSGDLYLLDFGSTFERTIGPGSEISLSVPRALLPPDSATKNGRTLTGGMASLLGDHLLHLCDALPRLTAVELPHVIDATMQLLIATLLPRCMTSNTPNATIRTVLINRVQRHIDAHLLEPGLTAESICKGVGISRSTLYRLFDHTGGIMHEIRRQRLYRIHQVLSTPGRPKERIRDIALRHGFTDEKYFIRIFKAQFGHTPRETPDRRQRADDAPPHLKGR